MIGPQLDHTKASYLPHRVQEPKRGIHRLLGGRISKKTANPGKNEDGTRAEEKNGTLEASDHKSQLVGPFFFDLLSLSFSFVLGMQSLNRRSYSLLHTGRHSYPEEDSSSLLPLSVYADQTADSASQADNTIVEVDPAEGRIRHGQIADVGQELQLTGRSLAVHAKKKRKKSQRPSMEISPCREIHNAAGR